MITEGWGPTKVREGKHAWKVISKGVSGPMAKTMMLNTDMCLAYTDNIIADQCMRHYGFRRVKWCKWTEDAG
jgi:hypothetical protein